MSDPAVTPTGMDKAYHRAVPLYYRLSLILKERIRTGVWQAGQALPGELPLCREFRASRGTIAQAVGLLVDEGLLVRERGRGTFVGRWDLVSTTTRLNVAVSEYLHQGIPARITKAEKATTTFPPQIAAFFSASPSDQGIRVSRERTYQGLPLSYVTNYLRLEVGQQITRRQLRRRSMLEVLENDLGFKVGPIRQSVEVALADVDVARILQIPLSSPTLLIQMQIRTTEHEPLDFIQTYFRADRYRYTQEFYRRSADSGQGEDRRVR